MTEFMQFHGLPALSWGQAAFIGVFLLLLVTLWLLPARFVEPEGGSAAWWTSVRFWAGIVCTIQILIYWIWG